VLWEGLNLPALHWEQLLLAEVAANVPPAQVVQEEACSSLKVPGGHATHSDEPWTGL
jgi:hypothetical protein